MTRADTHVPAFIRFLIVGGSFSLGYALVTAVLINFAAAPPLITSIVVYVLCIPLAFVAQRVFAFRDASAGRKGFVIYAATQVACLAFVATITRHFISYFFWWDTLLYLATAAVAAVASFAICRFIIFRSPKDEGAR